MSDAPILATVEQLGLVVGETIADDNPTALLYLATASGIVRDETNQYLSEVDDDVEYLRPRSGTAFLRQLPIIDFTQLETLQLDGTWAIAPAASYEVDLDTGMIDVLPQLVYFYWPTRNRSWRATYSHGYPAGELPDGAVGAVLGLAGRLWETPIAVENERVGERSIKYAMLESGFLPAEQIALDRLKIGRS